ncbi:MAG: hypothetical protein Alpg2KO_00250 [Alphaproteobacteria bacterium]
MRLDGLPNSNNRMLADPAAVLTFTLSDVPHLLACDRFSSVQANMAALARFLDGLRASLRHGVMSLDWMLASARCLPAPDG